MSVGWHARGYHPHFDGGAVTQMVTFSLAGSLPAELAERWQQELRRLKLEQMQAERLQRLEAHLDRGTGPVWLSQPEVADLVETSLLHFHEVRYRMLAWVVMSNHVHAVFTPSPANDLSAIVQSWKSYTAKMANKLLGRTGPFWQEDYFDRYMRDEMHLAAAIDYVEMNPVKAKLCEAPEQWRWSSASRRRTAVAVPGYAGVSPASRRCR